MDSTETEEGWLETADGAKLYTKTWKPTGGQPRARVAFIHGFSDHCNNYPELFSTFAKRGIAVYAFDQSASPPIQAICRRRFLHDISLTL